MLTKRIPKLSIRVRITLIVSLLLAVITLIFAGFSIASSKRHFSAVPLSQSLVSSYEPFVAQEITLGNLAKEATPAESIEMEITPIMPPETTIYAITAASTVVQSAQKSFGVEQVVALCLINLLGIGLTYLVLGRALRPLTLLSREIENIHEHNMDTLLPLIETKDEIGSLTHSFNAMLGRLRQSFAVQKNFAANAAHELRTPLTIMKSSLQLLELEEEPSTEDYRDTTTVCTETVEQMIALVNDLLRISSAQAEESSQVVLPVLVEQATTRQLEAIEARGLHLTLDCPALTLHTNATLLGCILDNLISNAVKYNKPDGEITLTARQEEEAFCLCVADTGLGIPDEALPYIFESFYRVDPSRSKEIEGNGLGLPIVKAAVEHLGGSIEVESCAGEGSSFLVRLPLQ